MGKVLVIEDDKFLASAYRAKLTKSGFEVQLAGDGEEGIQMLGSFTPDIILLDLVMPRKDGFATLPEIRKILKDVPVIVTSNLGQKEDLDKAMALGATDYLIKSDLSMVALINKINDTIKPSSS
ncbi:MAG TPA: response regulator [Candidatus Saccharimonadales bacterium]|nr:response regulator [Candidatus Saccharimonadales bacterium]